MKRLHVLSFILMFCGVSLFAQHNPRVTSATGKNTLPVKSVIKMENMTGLETPVSGVVSVPPAEDRFFSESLIGLTRLDLQSNNSTPSRVYNWGGGVVSATWQQSQEGEGGPTSYADRGTGYNTNAAGSFLAPVTTRVEAVRVGFSNYFVTASGEEWITSHSGAVPIKIHYAHRPQGGATWTEGDVPTTTPSGGLWTRSCAGGPDGNTIHLLYLTTPTANGGVTVEGLNGQLKYCRSTNNGQTWDKVDISLPGIDSNNWLGITAEAYAIDAQNNTVAIAIFDWTNDVVMIKSDDNGDTWAAPRIVNDFPLTKWDFDDGYTFDDISASYNADIFPSPNNVSDSLALLTTDETGTVLVDNDGIVHVYYSSLFVRDPDTTADNSLNWYPGYDLGIIYWNDLLDDNDKIFAGYSPDLNGDGTWGSPDNGNPQTFAYDGYGFIGFSTLPSAGMDAAGNLYVTYTANHELNFTTDGFWFKQPFIVRAEASDWTSWGTPKAVLDESLVEDFTVTSFSENYYGIMAQNVDNNAHVIWQQDFELGLTTTLTGVQLPNFNEERYIAYPVDLLSAAKEQPNTIRDIAVMPNPATDKARVRFDLEESGSLTLEVFNLAGKRIQIQQTNVASGTINLDLDTGGLYNGLYFIRVSTDNGSAVTKLTIAK